MQDNQNVFAHPAHCKDTTDCLAPFCDCARIEVRERCKGCGTEGVQLDDGKCANCASLEETHPPQRALCPHVGDCNDIPKGLRCAACPFGIRMKEYRCTCGGKVTAPRGKTHVPCPNCPGVAV